MKSNKFLKLFLAIFTIINFNTLFGAAAKDDQKEAPIKFEVRVFVDNKFLHALKINARRDNTISAIKKTIQKHLALKNPENFNVRISLQKVNPNCTIEQMQIDDSSNDHLKVSDLPKEFSFIANIKSKK